MAKKRNANALFWVLMRNAERDIIVESLIENRSIRGSARALGVSVPVIAMRVKALGIKFGGEQTKSLLTFEQREALREAGKSTARKTKPKLHVVSGGMNGAATNNGEIEDEDLDEDDRDEDELDDDDVEVDADEDVDDSELDEIAEDSEDEEDEDDLEDEADDPDLDVDAEIDEIDEDDEDEDDLGKKASGKKANAKTDD